MILNELRLIRDRILVRPDAKLAESAGGIAIPDTVLADNPNYYNMTGVVVKVGDGVREDVYRCIMRQCAFETGRTIGERCPACGAVQEFLVAGERHGFDVAVGDRVLFGRFAGKQIEVEESRLEMHGGAITFGVKVGDMVHPETIQSKYLVMRESEVLGILDGSERVLPGYQAPRWNKPTKGLTPTVTSRE